MFLTGGIFCMKKKATKTRIGKGNKRATRNPTNNGLAQGASNSAWPMWAPNNMKRKTRGASPFTGTSGSSY